MRPCGQRLAVPVQDVIDPVLQRVKRLFGEALGREASRFFGVRLEPGDAGGVGRQQARENAITHLLRRFFENSPELLMLNLIQGKKIDSKELARLRKRIAEDKS